MYLQHAPSFGDSGSSDIFNTRPSDFFGSTNSSYIFTYLKHANSFGDCDYIQNTSPHFAILAHPFTWRFRFIMDLQHAPVIWRFRFMMYLQHAPSFGDSGSSHILDTPPHLTIPVHHAFSTRPLFCDSGTSYILNTPPHLAITVHHVTIMYLEHLPSFGPGILVTQYPAIPTKTLLLPLGSCEPVGPFQARR